MTEDETNYRLGRAAGEVFTDKLNKLFKQFRKDYETSDPNFDNEAYLDGFTQYVHDNMEF